MNASVWPDILVRCFCVPSQFFLFEEKASQTPESRPSAKSFFEGKDEDPGTFEHEACRACLVTLEMSKIAVLQSADPEISKLAREIVESHSVILDRLAQKILGEGGTPNGELPSESAESLGELLHTSPDEFPIRYLESLIPALEEVHAIFSHAGSYCRGYSSCDFAGSCLAGFERELRLAGKLRKPVLV